MIFDFEAEVVVKATGYVEANSLEDARNKIEFGQAEFESIEDDVIEVADVKSVTKEDTEPYTLASLGLRESDFL